MTEKATTHELAPGSSKASKADLIVGKQVLDNLQAVVPFAQGLILSVLPRGAMHMIQPGRIPETMFKNYTREFHRQDRAAWQALLKERAIRGGEAWPGSSFEESAFYRIVLEPHGLRHVVAAPLAAPILGGYPGVAYLCRLASGGEFTDAELERINTVCRDADEMMARTRSARNEEAQVDGDPWGHQAPQRFFVYDSQAKLVFPAQKAKLDERLEEQVQHTVQDALEQSNRGYTPGDRVMLPDMNGDLWVFHLVVHREFPALGAGPFVFLCLQPETAEWVAVRPGDVQADTELVRLLPTLKFMRQEFSRNPTLHEIARKAHLSPFHFHRRFTDLIGQTPKHFLLGCQITQAKRMLVARKRELAKLATDCGFAHQSHFTSRFKQATGLTPTRWRRLAAELIRESAGE